MACISSHAQPAWFEPRFAGTHVQFLANVIRRQDGKIIESNAARMNVLPHDSVVLAATRDDVAMGKNGNAVLISYGNPSESDVKSLGINAATATDLDRVLRLSENWPGGWWFESLGEGYTVRTLSNLSKFGQSMTQATFGSNLTSLVKNGGTEMFALLAVTTRSMLASGLSKLPKLAWGCYPSSRSDNSDHEVLSDFVHRLRTNVSNVRLAKRGEPLFTRHKFSSRRSAGGNADRTDPREQIETLHLNPAYRGKLRGRNVIVVDDCTTYGVSFGVASAFLKKAGAASVHGIALGKFGDCLSKYDISIGSDPFSPVSSSQCASSLQSGSGSTNYKTQDLLKGLL